jgi:hypothetical protein
MKHMTPPQQQQQQQQGLRNMVQARQGHEQLLTRTSIFRTWWGTGRNIKQQQQQRGM